MYSVDEIQKFFKCGRNKIYQIIHTGGFPKIKIGKQYYIPKEKFEKWIEQNTYYNVVI